MYTADHGYFHIFFRLRLYVMYIFFCRGDKCHLNSLLYNAQINNDCFMHVKLGCLDVYIFFIFITQNDIRQEDQIIAKKFLHIYAEIKKSKVRQSCMIHQDMLDEVFIREHDNVKVPHMCDAPVNKRSSQALKQCGVTRMNIKSKRFSCS